MNAKADVPLPQEELDPEATINAATEGNSDLLFNAAKALKDQIDDELDINELKGSDSKKNDLEKVAQDASLDIIASTQSAATLGDDPVRLYLKDIGSIELLDVNHGY